MVSDVRDDTAGTDFVVVMVVGDENAVWEMVGESAGADMSGDELRPRAGDDNDVCCNDPSRCGGTLEERRDEHFPSR